MYVVNTKKFWSKVTPTQLRQPLDFNNMTEETHRILQHKVRYQKNVWLLLWSHLLGAQARLRLQLYFRVSHEFLLHLKLNKKRNIFLWYWILLRCNL